MLFANMLILNPTCSQSETIMLHQSMYSYLLSVLLVRTSHLYIVKDLGLYILYENHFTLHFIYSLMHSIWGHFILHQNWFIPMLSFSAPPIILLCFIGHCILSISFIL